MSRVKRYERGHVPECGWLRVQGQDAVLYIPAAPSPEEAREAARLLVEAAEEAEKPKLPELVVGRWYVVRGPAPGFPPFPRRCSPDAGQGQAYEWKRAVFEDAVRDGWTVAPLIVDGRHL